jgi:hypothetical protein
MSRESEDNARAKSEFASWKFEAIELLNVGVPAREFRVAVCLLSYMNWRTKLIYPSQRTMSVMLKMDESAVRRAIKRLTELHVLEVERTNRKETNRYWFSDAQLQAFYELRNDRRELARLGDRAKMSAQNSPEQEKPPGHQQEEPPTPDSAEVSAEPLNGTINGKHQESSANEAACNLDDPSAVPREESGGDASPQGERGGGAFRDRWHVSAALLDSPILKSAITAKSPAQSLDELERKQAGNWARVDPALSRGRRWLTS